MTNLRNTEEAVKSPLRAEACQLAVIAPATTLNSFAGKCSGFEADYLPTLLTAINLSGAVDRFRHQKDADAPKTSVITIAIEGETMNAVNVEGKMVPIKQRITEEAMYSLIESFNNDLLIDLDHSSELGGSTESAGWIKRLAIGPDYKTVVADVEWTPLGEEKLLNKLYRYLSPVYTGAITKEADDYVLNIQSLKSVGLTNRPNIPELGEISLNRAQLPDSSQTYNNAMKYTQLLTLLGLTATATDQEGVDALNKIIADRDGAKTRVTTLETENASLLNSVRDKEKLRFPNALAVEGAEANFDTLYALNSDACLSQYQAMETALSSAPAVAQKRTPQYTAANAKQPDSSFSEESTEFSDPALVAAANALVAEGKETNLVVAYNRAMAEQNK